MTVPRDQVAAVVGLGDIHSFRVYVQMSSRGNSADRLMHGAAGDVGPLSSPTLMWTAPWSVSADQPPVSEQYW